MGSVMFQASNFLVLSILFLYFISSNFNVRSIKQSYINYSKPWHIPEPNNDALKILPYQAPSKSLAKEKIAIILELPFFSITIDPNITWHNESWYTLAADAVVDVGPLLSF
jgi:hypothetical protein